MLADGDGNPIGLRGREPSPSHCSILDAGA